MTVQFALNDGCKDEDLLAEQQHLVTIQVTLNDANNSEDALENASGESHHPLKKFVHGHARNDKDLLKWSFNARIKVCSSTWSRCMTKKR